MNFHKTDIETNMVFNISKSKNKLSIIAWVFFILFYRLLMCFSYLPELANGESNNIWKAINVANGKDIYTNPEALPLEIFQYTPLSELPIILIAKIFNNKSPDYLYFVTTFGRVYELIMNIIMCFIIYKISKKWLIGKNEFINILIAVFSFTLLTYPAFTIRPDATLLCFIFLTIWSYFKFEDTEDIKWLFLTSLLFTLCFFIKQDGILIAIPIGLRLLFTKRVIFLIKLIIISSIIFIITLLIAQKIFGEYFFICIFKGLNNVASVKQILQVFDRTFSFYSIHITLGILFSIYFLTKKKLEKISFISLLSIFYLLTAILTSSKSGSWVNYYTPFILFSTIIILNFFNQIELVKKYKKKLFIMGFTIIVSVFFILKQIYTYNSPFLKPLNGKAEYYNKFNEIKKLKNKLNLKQNEYILTINQLDRNFLAYNSIMINTEYYNYASFTYYRFKKLKNKKIKYLIYNKEDKPTIDYLINFFNLKNQQFETLSENKNHTILKNINYSNN